MPEGTPKKDPAPVEQTAEVVATTVPVGDPSQSAREAEAARAVEYGSYIATDNIWVGNALAFRSGDPVPVSHVERGVVPKLLVEKRKES